MLKNLFLLGFTAWICAPIAAASDQNTPSDRTIELQLSEALMNRVFHREIETTTLIDDFVMGAWVTGSTSTQGSVRLFFYPNQDYAVIGLDAQATVNALTTSHVQPRFDIDISAYATSGSTVQSRKWCYIEPKAAAFSADKAGTSVATWIRFNGVDAAASGIFFPRLREGIARRAAWDQLLVNQARLEYQTSLSVQSKFSEYFDDEFSRTVDDANRQWLEGFWHPFVEGDTLPGQPAISTTEKYLHIAVKGSPVTGPDKPELSDEYAARGFVHANFFHDFGVKRMAGKTLTEQEFKRLFSWLDDASETVSRNLNAQDPNALLTSFHPTRPLDVTIDNGVLTLIIRTTRFDRGDRAYPPMYIRFAYKIDKNAAGEYEGQRQDTVAAFPPRVETNPDAPLTQEEKIAKQVIERRFREIYLPRTIDLSKIKMPMRFENLGHLYTQTITADHGWIAIGLVDHP